MQHTALPFLHHHLPGEKPTSNVLIYLETNTLITHSNTIHFCSMPAVSLNCTILYALKPNLDAVNENGQKSLNSYNKCCTGTNIKHVHCSLLTKCQVCLPCHINCTKSLGQSATCPNSSQLSQDQGSHPLITPPSQNKKAGYSHQSHQDQRKLIHGQLVSSKIYDVLGFR